MIHNKVYTSATDLKFDMWSYVVLQDGRLDATEVQQWIMPDDYDHAIAESKHLIYQADDDKVR